MLGCVYCEGEVAIVANADQGFDDTARWTIFIKKTTDRSRFNRAPKEVIKITKLLSDISGRGGTFDWDQALVKNRCLGGLSRSRSWDAYVFHLDFIQGRIKPEDFGGKHS